MTGQVAARINPYPGLAPFDEQDSERFFGRDHEIEEVLERLTSRRILAVIGVSGCGKSSLIRAGVVPILRMGAVANLPALWRIYTLNPGNDPLGALRSALNRPAGWPLTSFDLVDHARVLLPAGESLLLIVDQFEEIFRYRGETFSQDGGSAASLFVNLLLKAVEQREVPIHVLLTMRSDFLGQCTEFRGLPEALNDCYYLVPRMTRLQQQDAIERPMQEQGQAAHPALVQRLLNDSADDPDHLPVLQHLLRRVWESWNAQGVGGPMGLADYDAVGGWANTINADAEAILRRFEAEQEGIRRVFQWITDCGTGERPIRRPRLFAECVEISGLPRDRLDQALRAFQERGLLRRSDIADASLVDLPHESVMWQWTRLKSWIAEEAEQAAQLRFFLQSARQNNPLTGLALESARRWRLGGQRKSAQRYLNSRELEETQASILRGERLEHQRRRRRVWIFSGVPALIIVLALILAWVAQKQRNAAQARELVAWAAVSLNEDPERSLILGLHSWATQRRMIAGLEEILHAAILQSQSRLTLRGHQDRVLAIALSPDGSKLATASADRTARVWDSATGRELLTLRGHQGAVSGIAWSPDGNKLATASYDRTAKVWEVGTGRELLTLSGHQDEVWTIAWSPDGKLATAGGDKTGKVWDSATGRELQTLRGHQDGITKIAWSPDARKLATGSVDNTAKVWDVATGDALLTLSGHQDEVVSIAWSPDASKLATGSADITAKVWDSATGRELLTFRGHRDEVTDIAWSGDGTKLATASYDATAKVWEPATGRELTTLRGHRGIINGIAWFRDGSKLATAGDDRSAKVWETLTGHELPALRGHSRSISEIAWSPDGSKLATASDDKTAKVWQAQTGRELLTLRGHQDRVTSIAWSPDGSKLATASDDKTARVWQAQTGRELLTLSGHQDRVVGVAWSPDGRKLATASTDKVARVWDAVTGRELLALRGHQYALWRVSWSPDGTKLATASVDQTAKVWEAGSGREMLTLRGHQDEIWSVEWSPDGLKLATASNDGTVRIWDAATGRELMSLRSHQALVRHLAWSPDGKKLATGSYDGRVQVLEMETGSELLTLHGHQSEVHDVAWSPDGRHLASAGDDSIGQVYTLDQAELLRLVKSRTTRELMPDECRRYLNIDPCPRLPDIP